MENFFRKHIEGFLTVLALVMVGAMVACFVWGIVFVSEDLDSVFGSKPAATQTVNFNLSGAGNLNLRGLVQQ